MDPIAYQSTETLREKAAEIISRPEYSLDKPPSDNTWLFALLIEIIDWILVPFRWLFSMTEGLPGLLRWSIVVSLALLLLLLIGHITYTFLSAIRMQKRIASLEPKSRRAGLDPDELERLAYEASLKSDYMTAIRFLFRAGVVRIERSEKRPNRPGTTNRELLRRYRDKPLLSDPLRQLVDTIDRKWYGDDDCSDADYTVCQSAHRDLCRAIEEPAHAVSA